VETGSNDCRVTRAVQIDLFTAQVLCRVSYWVLGSYWKQLLTLGETGPPTFRLRGPIMYWSPNFLAVAFVTSVTRMHDLASEFSKIFEGNTPRPSQREGKTPYCTQHPALPLARRGLQPGVWTQTLVRLNFSVVVASLAINHKVVQNKPFKLAVQERFEMSQNNIRNTYKSRL